MPEHRPRIVIVGGGFRGLVAAKALRRTPADVTLGGVLDMEAMVPKLLILQNFRRRISTSGTPPVRARSGLYN